MPAIPYADHDTAPEGESWSAPSLSDFTDASWDDLSDAEKRRIAAHFVWSESGNPPDKFSDLGGGHHRPGKSGVGPAVWRAVSSGRMQQATWSDDAGVRSHLEQHYHQFDKKAPWEDAADDLIATVSDFLAERARRLPHSGGWYRVQAAEDGDTPAELWIYDEISWFGVTAKDFVAELRAIDAKRLTLHLNSPGGDVFDGIAIYHALREHPAKVTTRIEGLAASVASVIAMASDQVVMAEHAQMMIHDPWALTIGDAADHTKQAQVLNQMGDELARIYAKKADTGYRQWRQKMQDETWYTARDAVDAGLADAIDTGAKASIPKTFDLSRFRHPPAELGHLRDAGADHLRDAGARLGKRDAERALRAHGFPRQLAAQLVARAWAPEPATAEPDPEALQLYLEFQRLRAEGAYR